MPTLAQRRSHLGSGSTRMLQFLMEFGIIGHWERPYAYQEFLKLLSDLPCACPCHRPTTTCSCSALQNGPGRFQHRVILHRTPIYCSILELPNFYQVGHLPLSHPKDGGQLYLANMGIPKNVYKEVILRTHFPRINSAQHYFRLVSSLPLPLAPSL